MEKHDHCSCSHLHDHNRQPKIALRWLLSLVFLALAFIIMRPFIAKQLLSRASSYMTCELFNDAIRSYEKAVFIDRNNVMAWDMLGYGYKSNGNLEKSIYAYQQAIKADPKDKSANFSLGVILASEKRVTYGYFIMSKGGKKVFKVTDRIGVACAGLVGDMQILAKEMEVQANLFNMDVGRKITVRSAAKLLANVLFNRRYSPLFTQTIVGGLDEEGASIYILDVLGSLIPDKYAVVGSGTEIAIGVLEEGYNENIGVDEMKDLVTRSIKSAISRDSMSGDGIDFLIITKNGVTEESIKF